MNNNGNYILIRIDECGDECEVERYTLNLDLDDDELEVWKARKYAVARERYPEARGFYFEDRRNWNSIIAMMMNDPSLDFEDFCY